MSQNTHQSSALRLCIVFLSMIFFRLLLLRKDFQIFLSKARRKTVQILEKYFKNRQNNYEKQNFTWKRGKYI